MGRKGDIVSKVIGVRAPIRVYTKLLNEASDKGISISQYCLSLLTKDNFNKGGQTEIEYKEKIIYRDKIVEVPKIEYRDKIVEKIIERKNDEHIALLINKINSLELENASLRPKKYTTKSTKDKKECHPDYIWEQHPSGDYINMGKRSDRR